MLLYEPEHLIGLDESLVRLFAQCGLAGESICQPASWRIQSCATPSSA